MSMIGCQPNHKKTGKDTSSKISENAFKLPDSLSARRISFVLKLRDHVAQKYWEGFANKRSEGTFIYFNKESSEIFFPTKRVLNKIENYETYSEDYVISPRTDSIPYHFELMITFDKSQVDRFYYDHPVQQFLSVEETTEFIPSIISTEAWATLVIHEMFHHFQYNNLTFREYAKSNIGSIPYDIRNLQQLCEDNSDFLALVQQENDQLMDAISAQKDSSLIAHIESYLNNRKHRIKAYKEQHPFMDVVESYYILQEGSARYIEYQCANVLSEFATKPDSINIIDDPRFNFFREFVNFDVTDENFSWLTYAGPTTYHYSIGFNQMRLLDKLGVKYKENLFNNPSKALHKYLEEYLINTSSSKNYGD